MDSKIILITGSTDGIGKITAKTLLQHGHTVIIHGRNKSKAALVCEQLKSETGNKTIDYVVADLLQLSEVNLLAGEIKRKYNHLVC